MTTVPTRPPVHPPAPGAPLADSGELLRRLPKVSLHDHLEGSLRLSTVLDISQRDGLPLPADDLPGLLRWFDRQKTSGSLVEYLRPFDHTVAVLQTPDDLHRAGREYVQDVAEDGIRYAEVRWAPEAVQRRGTSLDEAIEALAAGIAAGEADQIAAGHRVQVRQIISAMRQEKRSAEVAAAALRHHDPTRPGGVVAFDLAGPELGFPAGLHREALDAAARGHLNVTLHAGEADGPASIAGALVDGRAQRLGHGVRIVQDITVSGSGLHLGPVAARVRDRAIPLETSPSSNLHTGAFTDAGEGLRDHPFDLLYRNGFAVTVNTDNRTMSETTLTRELQLLTAAFGYGLTDLRTFQLTAASSAFLDLDSRRELVREVERGFETASRR